jgi:branched-chain amino acid transport system substrate-binding protein
MDMNLKRTIMIGALVATLGVGAIASVGAQDDTLDTLRIGFIGRANGRGAELDQQLYQAAVTAAQQINVGDDDDEAGVRASDDTRYNLEVVFYGAETADDAVDAYEEALGDDVIAILGPQEADHVEAIADADTQGLALISASPQLSVTSGNGIFRAAAAHDDWAEALANYLVDERHLTRIAVLSSNTDEALAGTDAFKTAAGDANIALDLVREADESDFSEDVRSLRDSDAEALVVWALDAQMIALLDELRGSNWDGIVIYAGLDNAFVADAGAELAAGIYGPMQWNASAYDARSGEFVADYSAEWGIAPPDAAAAYSDVVYLLTQSISDVGIDGSAIRSNLSNQDYAGIQGAYDNAQTDALRLMQVQPDGALIEAAQYANGECVNCADLWWADSSAVAATTTETLRIGLIASLDGAAEDIGTQIEDAARLAIREINDAGGVVGPNSTRYLLDLVAYNATNAETAEAAFNQAVQDGVALIIGPDTNGQVMPNAFRAENNETLQLVSATLDQIGLNSGGYLFQMRANDTALAQAAASYLVDVREMTRFASVAIRTDYGLDGAAAFNDVVNASDDGELVLEMEHSVDATDFAGIVDQLVAANVEAISMWSSQPAAEVLMAELSVRGWDGVMVYGFMTPAFAQTLGDVPFEVASPVSWWADGQDWFGSAFAEGYRERYGADPLPQAAAYYDAVHLIGRGLDEAGTSGLRAWLEGVDEFVGVQGSYRPDAYGSSELSRNVTLLSVSGGTTEVIARYDDGVCLIGCGG